MFARYDDDNVEWKKMSQEISSEMKKGYQMDSMQPRSNVPIPFEVLLSSPFCWKPGKICSFILKSPDSVIYGSENDPWIQQLNNRAIDWGLWNSNSKWSEVLGEDYKILLTYKGKAVQVKKGKKPPKLDTRSVPELLRLIRNKYKHSNEFKPAQKKLLGWYRENNTDSERDDYLFAKYWTGKFPNLVPFLWEQFKGHRENLREFYPVSLEQHYLSDWCFDVAIFPREVSCCCRDQLDQGLVEERYVAVGNGGTLELSAALSGDFIAGILDASSLLEILITNDNISFKWDDKIDEVLAYEIIPSEKSMISGILCSTLIISSVSEKISAKVAGNGNVRIFTNQNAIEDICDKFQNTGGFEYKPICWNDLSESTRILIESGNNFSIKLPCNDISINEAFPENKSDRLKILESLAGPQLKQLLRERKMEILQKSKLPSLASCKGYLPRRIFCRDYLNGTIFLRCRYDEFFVILNSSLENFQRSFQKNKITVIEHPSDINDKMDLRTTTSRAFLLENDIHDHNLRRSLTWNLEKASSYVGRFHLLRCIRDRTFKWISSYDGSYSFPPVEEKFMKAARDERVHTEDGFLRYLNEIREEQIIFIGDKAGSGKSQVLISLALQMVKMYQDTFVVLVSMKEFLEILKKQDKYSSTGMIPKHCVISTIKEITCSNAFESHLLEYLLQKGSSSKIKFELLLDGLDEVDFELRVMAFRTLTTIRNNLHCVRVWATFREHMLPEVWSRFHCLGYKLDYLSTKEQIGILRNYWLTSFLENGNGEGVPSSKSLDEFAMKCIKIPLSEQGSGFAGSPILLQIIAEVYESSVITSATIDLSTINTEHSFVGLYKAIMDRKLEIYFKEKEQLGELNMNKNKRYIKMLRKHFINSHRYFAIKFIFPANVAVKFESELLGEDESGEDEQLQIEIQNHGIVESCEPLRFNHRTFAELIIADFVYEKVSACIQKGKDLDSLDETFRNFVWDTVLSYKHNQMGRISVTGSGPSYTEFVYPTVSKFLNGIIGDGNWLKNMPESRRTLLGLVEPILQDKYKTLMVHELAPLFYLTTGPEFANISAILAASSKQIFDLFILCLGTTFYSQVKSVIESDAENFGPKVWHKLQYHHAINFCITHWILSGIGGRGNWAEFSDVSEWIKCIVDKDISVLETKCAQSRTPLLLLSKMVHIDNSIDSKGLQLVDFFIKVLGANVNATDNKGNTVLHVGDSSYTNCASPDYIYTHLDNYSKLVKLFLENGCPESIVNQVNEDGNTPLHSALYNYGYKLLDVLEHFKNHGADFNIRDKSGNTLLHNAVQSRITHGVVSQEDKNVYRPRFIRKLVLCGADILYKNSSGQTALHLVVELGDIIMTKFLIHENPICLFALDNEGKSVLEYETTHMVRKCLEHTIGFYEF